MNLEGGREYKQFELPGNLFNVSNGQQISSGGRNYVATVNPNGTRSFSLAGGSSGQGVDINAPVAMAQNQRGELQNLFNTQRGEEQNFLNRYSSTIKNQPTMSVIAERLGNELGLPTLRQNATMLRTELSNLPYTYSAATTGRDVNANQLSRIIGQKASELAPTVTAAENALSSAESNLTTRLGYEADERNRELLPFEMESSFLSQRMARETTGYTSAMQNELTALIAKMNAGVTLSEGERNRAHELAVAEQNYKNQLSLQDRQFKFQEGQQNREFDFQREQREFDPLGLF